MNPSREGAVVTKNFSEGKAGTSIPGQIKKFRDPLGGKMRGDKKRGKKRR